MPSRWKTSGLLGSRRANAATNRESTAYWALIGDYHNDCAARITAPFAQGVALWQKPWKPGERRLPKSIQTCNNAQLTPQSARGG